MAAKWARTFSVSVRRLLGYMMAAAGFSAAAANGTTNPGGDPCLYCHEYDSVQHGTADNPLRLRNFNTGVQTWGKNSVCLVCHATSGATGVQPAAGYTLKTATRKVNKYHYGSKHSTSLTGGQFCWDCHDAHGDRAGATDGRPIAMVHKKPAKGSDSVTGMPTFLTVTTVGNFVAKTNAANFSKTTAPYNALCNVCHDYKAADPNKMVHYTATSSDSHQSTSVCTTCHSHSADTAYDGNAYQGSASACDGCHGGNNSGQLSVSTTAGHALHYNQATAFNHYTGSNKHTSAAYGFACKNCHGTTLTNHQNGGTANILGTIGYTQGGTVTADSLGYNYYSGDTCSQNACHQDGKGGAPKTATFSWGSAKTSPNCNKCHNGAGDASPTWSGAHTKHINGYNGNSRLTCNACHTSPEGNLRTANFGTVGYKAYWGFSSALSGKRVVTSIQLGDNRNSNICMPCHSQRASGQEIKDVFATGSFKQYSAGSAIYPHAAMPAAIFYGKGGYEFTVQNGSTNNGFAYQDRARHQRIGNYGTTGTGYNNTGITQGSCVGCHMTTTGKTHNLEIGAKDANGNLTSLTSSECAKCHPSNFTYQDLNARKDELAALVTSLGNLLVKKGITVDGVNPLPERKPLDMSLGAKNNTIAEKNMGAWFNWYLFKTSDPAAYAHNPSYARRLLTDSIDYLDDGILNGTAANTILAMSNVSTSPYYNPTVVTTTIASSAVAYTTEPGCTGCHFGTGPNMLNGESIPGIEQAPHYNTNNALVPGQTFTQAQFVVAGAQCNFCHGYGHGTDSPNYSASKAAYPSLSSVQGKGILKNYAESAHGEINGLAWTDYNFLNLSSRSACTPCHTTQGFVNAVASANANGGKIATPAFIGNAADATKQVLGCNACHSSTTWKSSVRTIDGDYQAAMGGFSLTAPAYISYKSVGESNICIPCHASRENGASINASTANFASTSFKNPHYLAAAAVFYGQGGFQFYSSGVRYNTYGAAGKVGSKYTCS